MGPTKSSQPLSGAKGQELPQLAQEVLLRDGPLVDQLAKACPERSEGKDPSPIRRNRSQPMPHLRKAFPPLQHPYYVGAKPCYSAASCIALTQSPG